MLYNMASVTLQRLATWSGGRIDYPSPTHHTVGTPPKLPVFKNVILYKDCFF